MHVSIPLSHLIPSKRNPRRVKPDRDAHHRLVSLIRSQGLLQPLVIRPAEDKSKQFIVIAGNRRLAALREIHRSNGDPKIPCELRKVDASEADNLALGENFGQEPMHPLDEAEAFTRLAHEDGKNASAISAEFGVSEQYVRQRIKLGTLAPVIKAAYREGSIDTSMAEAFASVPPDKQLEVWKEVGGHPRDAEHVRNIIANDWISAQHALFPVNDLSAAAISQDLFGQDVLVERKAFMEAQAKALELRQHAMKEDGWSDAIVGQRQDVQDRLLSMNPLPKEYDASTTSKLRKIEADRTKLERLASKVGEGDEVRMERLNRRYQALESKERQLTSHAVPCFSEKTKARGTVFLILDPDGRVHEEYRIPRKSADSSGNSRSSDGDAPSDSEVPSSNEVSDRQRAVLFTHQALAVRKALLDAHMPRLCVLAMILHQEVQSDALAIRRDANGTTLHATNSEGFKSEEMDALTKFGSSLDPIRPNQRVEEERAYKTFRQLPRKKLEALIELLTVNLLTAHLHRPTSLVVTLAKELKVRLRDMWRPDAEWLGGYQKIQLGELITSLLGTAHAPAPERKKSELVTQLAKLFADAADGKLQDKELADRVNRWLPTTVAEALRPAA